MASKMRIWWQGKKKVISSNVKTVLEKEVSEQSNEENKNDDGEEKIDTTSKSKKDKTPKVDKINIEEKLMESELQEFSNLIDTIIEKAKYLLKVQLPKVWNQEDKNEEYLILDPFSGENELEMDNKFLDISNRLKSFQKIQTSKRTIKNYDEIDGKEIFNSSGASILAFLQNSLPLSDIKKKMEETYINALGRF